MAEYTATILWTRGDAAFLDNRYSRVHEWLFDGGINVPASSSPQVVPPPLSSAAAVDPEEAFVAAVASCHMLWFLSIAAKRRFLVDSYSDTARGVMRKNDAGKLWIAEIVLHPQVTFAGTQPAADDLAAMHHAAHAECFIANSIRTDVRVAV